MNKKRLTGLMAFLSMLPFVSAQFGSGNLGYFFETGMRDVIDAVVGFGTPVFEIIIGDYSGSEFFFAKVLLLILLFVVINSIVSKLSFVKGKTPREDKKAVGLIIALVISILAVRFISENDFFLGILLPYGTLGVAISVLLPSIIFFYFIHTAGLGSIGRRISWIFYIIIFLVLWYTRYPLGGAMDLIYGWTGFALFLLLIFDKKIHYYFAAHELNIFYRGANAKTIAGLQAEYLSILNVDTPEAQTRRDAIESRLSSLNASLP